MIITFCLGIFFLIPLSVTHALDFGTNVLVQATDKQLLKMKLDDEALTIFLIDTSGNMQNKDKQTTIDLINRFAVESEQARIAVIAYDNDSQVLVAPTTDSTVIREKLSTLESSGESNLTAGLKTAEELIKQSQNQKANIFIIADNAPTAGDTLKKGTYTSKDSHSYKYANAADAYAFEIAVGIVPDSFIVTTEGYEYHNMTEEAIRQVVDSIEWEDYYNYKITPYEGTDEEFDKLILIYDGRLRQRNSDSRVDEGEIEPVQG